MIKPSPVKASAKFIGREQISEFVYEFKFEMVSPDKLESIAGQYISISIDSTTRRQYSISTSPLESQKEFELILDIRPQGVGVKYLMSLDSGETIDFIGQIGLFVLPESLSKNLYFFSTGTGLGPIKSMIETLIISGKSKETNIHLYFGSRSSSNIIYQEVFNKYKEEQSIQEYRITISREKNADYDQGHVTQYIDKKLINNIENAQFYLCGSGNMIESVIELLKSNGACKEQLILEKFY